MVLSEAEVRAVRAKLEGEPALVVGLLECEGLPVREGLAVPLRLCKWVGVHEVVTVAVTQVVAEGERV